MIEENNHSKNKWAMLNISSNDDLDEDKNL